MATPPASDPEHLQRLREDAYRRLQRDEPLPPPLPPVPAAAYGCPPPPRPSALRRYLILALAVLVGVVVWLILGGRNPIVNPAPVYGGPPTRPGPPAWIWFLSRFF